MKFRIDLPRPVPLLDSLLRRRAWDRTEGDDWNLYWGEGLPAANANKVGEAPRYCNHLAGISELTDKIRLYRLLSRCRNRQTDPALRELWSFFPQVFEMPFEFSAFRRAAHDSPGAVWIAKPSGGSRGEGQFLLADPEKAPLAEGWLVQRYIDEPIFWMTGSIR